MTDTDRSKEAAEGAGAGAGAGVGESSSPDAGADVQVQVHDTAMQTIITISLRHTPELSSIMTSASASASASALEGKVAGLTFAETQAILAAGYGEWLKAYWLPTQRRKHHCASLLKFQIKTTTVPKVDNDEDDHDHDHYLLVDTMVVIEQQTSTCPVLTSTTLNNNSSSSSSASTSTIVLPPQDYWIKSLASALKKVVVEDLGHMDAAELKAIIPTENDSEGRSLQDLHAMERQLQVKVVFGVHDDENDDDNGESNNISNGDTIHSNGGDDDDGSNKKKGVTWSVSVTGAGSGSGSGTTGSQHYSHHVLLVGPKAKLQKKCFAIRNLLAHYHWRLTGKQVR
jgi:hypothetical protein